MDVGTLLYLALAVTVSLHALVAGWLTFSGPRERLWERLALLTTLTTMLFALSLLFPAFLVRGFEANPLMLGYGWAGALVLEALAVFAVRRASPRFATAGVFLALLLLPMSWVVKKGLDYRQRRSEWHCVQHAYVTPR